MKLSTRIKKTGIEEWKKIVLVVDCKERHTVTTFEDADEVHNDLLARGCKLLPQESPVYNSKKSLIFHYTSTTYREWCEG